MKILVKMVYLEGICMAKADSHVVREQCDKENPKGPVLFVLLRLQQYNVASSRFVASEHCSCVIFCFDIHS